MCCYRNIRALQKWQELKRKFPDVTEKIENIEDNILKENLTWLNLCRFNDENRKKLTDYIVQKQKENLGVARGVVAFMVEEGCLDIEKIEEKIFYAQLDLPEDTNKASEVVYKRLKNLIRT